MASKNRGTAAAKRRDTRTVVDLGSRAHWNAVRSPFRLGLLEILSAGGNATARELAETLGIDPPLIHYHLGLLEKAGLVKGEKQPGTRSKVFSASSADLKVHFNPRSKMEQERAERISEGWLRASLDDMITAVHPGSENGHSDANNRILVNWETLSPTEIRELGAHFKSVEQIISKARKRRRAKSRGTENQQATCHVVFGLLPGAQWMPPNSEVEVSRNGK